ncbi:hypothetical protein HKD37_01G001262 [Glycine soja]
MSPPPLGPHNHSQIHLKLSGRLPLPALISADLHTTYSLKLSGTWTFLSLELFDYAEASRKGQTLLRNLISGLNSEYAQLILLPDSSSRSAEMCCPQRMAR